MLNKLSHYVEQFKLLRKKSSNLEFDVTKIVKVYKNQQLPLRGVKFTDDIFPPNENSILAKDSSGNFIDQKDGPRLAGLFNTSEIEWKRSTDIFPHPLLFEGTINVEDIRQGKIGNCYFLSAIAALCEFPTLISQKFISKQISPDGFYQIILFIDGEYQIVFLDDYFPVWKGTNMLYFAKPNSFELWALLLEKAWAKINGGYANIISGWPSDVFRAITGFACEQLTHCDNDIERLWAIMHTVDRNFGIVCASTRNDMDVETIGLVKNHAYTVMNTAEVVVDEVSEKKVKLCLLRNPWGYKEWKGDWSDGSTLWNENIIKQIEGYEKISNMKGCFWMCVEDFKKYFMRSDICQIIYSSRLRFIDYEEKDLNHPQVLNIYLPEDGMLSVSVIEKNWRYNRELRDVPHPTSLVIAKYEPETKTITRIYADYDCYQDAEKSRLMNKGYYIIWFYKVYAQNALPKPCFVRLKIACDVDYKLSQIGKDDKFLIIREIIAQGVKHTRRNSNDTKLQMFYDISNSFNKSGLAYRIVLNPFNTKCQHWKNDASKVEGITLLPPYNNSASFDFWVAPCSYAVILGIQNDKYGTHWFNVESTVETYECSEGYEPPGVVHIDFDAFCRSDVSEGEHKVDFVTSSFEVLSKVEIYPVIDHNKVWIEMLSKEHPVLMKEVIKLKEKDNEWRLTWGVVNKKKGMYVGQMEDAASEGRGAFCFEEDGSVWVGYWESGCKGKYGKLFNKEMKLVYEGEYKGGVRNGQGKMYFNTGEWYEGEFKNGKREGKGRFYWDKTCYWEGMFNNNEMNGVGVYHDSNEEYEAKYVNGEYVE